jgi:hypothetical protein
MDDEIDATEGKRVAEALGQPAELDRGRSDIVRQTTDSLAVARAVQRINGAAGRLAACRARA